MYLEGGKITQRVEVRCMSSEFCNISPVVFSLLVFPMKTGVCTCRMVILEINVCLCIGEGLRIMFEYISLGLRND